MSDAADAVLRAVRRAMTEFDASAGPVLVACSGGADSLALAAACAQVAGGPRPTAGAVVVDHGMQAASASVAQTAADRCSQFGLAPVVVVAVEPDLTAGRGPEAAARLVRYQALEERADALGAAAVFLGHTADDQAETVALGLARGSGPRALAGMAASRGIYRRPLLGLRRSVVRAAFPDSKPWADPHNDDPRFARSRVRHRVLPVWEEELGPGVVAALARSAELVRAEVAAVDAWAADLAELHVSRNEQGRITVDATALRVRPAAVVARILRTAAVEAGARGGRLTAVHVAALTALVTDWRGQGQVDLPGGINARRISGTVVFVPAAAET